MLKDVLSRVLEGDALSREEARDALDRLLFKEVPAAQTAALLAMLKLRGPRAEEIAGFADSLAAAAQPFPGDPGDAIDTCGTGGDGSGTFNISTTSALVAAAAGAKVLKHGNRAATSRSGSADLLEAFGIPIELSPDAARACADRTNFAFLYARQYHPVLGKVAPIRSTIGFPTVFNLLGPLLNPAGVKRQVVGVYAPDVQELVAKALALRGAVHAMVLHGAGGLDEATPLGPFRALVVRTGEAIFEEERDPADLGVDRCKLEELQVDGPEESRNRALAVLDGDSGPSRDAVLLNAALSLEVAGKAKNWSEGFELAREAVDSGAARKLVDDLSGREKPSA